MTATATAEPTKPFAAEVIVAGGYRLKLERTATEDAEKITGTVPPSWDFGDWRAGGTDHEPSKPSAAEIEDACSKAIGFAIEIDLMSQVAPTDRPKESVIEIHFTRKKDAEGQPEPPPAESDEAKELRMANKKAKRIYDQNKAIRRMIRERDRAEAEAESAKKRVKSMDADIEEMRLELSDLIEGRTNNLFDRDDKPKAETNGQHKPSLPPVGAATDPRDNPDPIDVLLQYGLTEAILKKLKAADIPTMGALVRFSENQGLEGHSAPLTVIKGIKGATLEKLDNACAAYWAARGATVQAAVEAVAAATELLAEGAPAEGQQVEPAKAEADGSKEPETPADPEHGKKGAKRVKKLAIAPGTNGANGEASQA